MHHLADTFLSKVDRFTSTSGLLDKVISGIAAHLLPQFEAEALSCWGCCGERCDCFSSDVCICCSNGYRNCNPKCGCGRSAVALC